MSQPQQQAGAAPPTKSSGGGTRSAFLAKLPLIIRIAELCMTIIVLGLIIDPIKARLQSNVNHSALTYVAFAGYILINLVIIISEVSGEPMPKTALLMFAFVGGVLFVAAGALIIHDWRTMFYSPFTLPPKMYMDMMISSGILALFTSCLFFADVVITVRYALAEERAALREEEGERAALRGADERGGGGGGKRNSTGNDRQTALADFAV